MFSHYDPFNINPPGLPSLSAGIRATKKNCVNCHYAVDIGYQMQKTLGRSFAMPKWNAKLEKISLMLTQLFYLHT